MFLLHKTKIKIIFVEKSRKKGGFSKLHKPCRIMGENVDNAKNGAKVIHILKRLKNRYI